MENLNLYAQNKCPLRKSKSMDNMLSCGGNCLTKHTEGGNTAMITNSNDQIGPGENISHYTTNQVSNMLSPLQTHQPQYCQFPQVHISQQQQLPNIPPNSHMMTICYANNENCCQCTLHFDLSVLPFNSVLQYTEMIKNIHEDFKNQGYMLCSHRCCSTQKSPNQRTVSRASPSLVSSSSDYYAHSMSDPASAGPTASIQHPPIPYRPFEPAPSRSASLNSEQNQNSAAISSAISQFTFNPNNCALNQANTSNTNLNQKYHMMQRPFSSGSISNNFPSTSSNLISSHDSIATHIDTSDYQTTSPSDIPIDGNNTTSRKRPNTNSNNRFFETERIKKDKSEIEKKNRETTRRLQNTILEKSDENSKKIENVDKKVDNLSQDIGIVKNLVQNLSQLYSSHARGNACSCSSQSIPSNSNSTPNHNIVHVNQSGTATWSHMDQFHQQESIIRDNSSGCSSENDIGSLNI